MPPKRGVAYQFTRTLYSLASPGSFQINPTIASGDFKLSKNNGTITNLTNPPVVSPAGSVLVLFSLTATEMTSDRIDIIGVDQAGDEWGPYHESIETTVQVIDDLPTATVNADTLLKRDWTSVAGDPPTYSVWNALRFIRNVWSVIAGTPPVLHVKKEDGTTDAWSRNLTVDASAVPITGAN